MALVLGASHRRFESSRPEFTTYTTMNKADKIRLLIEFTNVSTDLQNSFKTKIDALTIFDGEADADQLKDTLLQKINQKYEKFLDKQIAIYDSFLSEEALDSSIEFYTSEVGQEILNAMPKINESLTNLGMQLSKEIMFELTDMMDLPEEEDFE